jgi:hypothetical protein
MQIQNYGRPVALRTGLAAGVPLSVGDLKGNYRDLHVHLLRSGLAARPRRWGGCSGEMFGLWRVTSGRAWT